MLEYRISKYSPDFRDEMGAYTLDEWTSISDIGRSFGGVVLTLEEYCRVEDAYVAVALSFLQESGQSSLVVCGLENCHLRPMEFGEGSLFDAEQIGPVIRHILREEYWCRLEGPSSFLHIGWDYYMYIGVPCQCPDTHELARSLRLYLEVFPSPYTLL